METDAIEFKEPLQLLDAEDNRVLMQACLSVNLYFHDADTPAVRKAILDIFAEYQTMMAGKLNWTTNPDTGSWKNLRKKAYITPDQWLLELDNEPWEFIYHGGEHHRDASDIRFNILGKPSPPPAYEKTKALSWVSINFPLSFFADWPEALQDVLLRWLTLLQPLHGNVAISTTHNHYRNYSYERLEYQWAQQFAGLDVSDFISHGLELDRQIKGVNWLTIIRNDILAPLGDMAIFEGIKGIKVWQAGEVLLIQAADKPALQTIPESYYALGQLLEPIRNKSYYTIHKTDAPGEVFDNGDDYAAWLGRFDQKP